VALRYKRAVCNHHTIANKMIPWCGVIPVELLKYRAPLFPLPKIDGFMQEDGSKDGFPDDEAGDGGPFYLDEFMLYG
jgi:hypothetical protein